MRNLYFRCLDLRGKDVGINCGYARPHGCILWYLRLLFSVMVEVPPLGDQGCVPWVARAPRRTFRTDAGGCGQVRFGWVAVLLALATAAGVFRAYSSCFSTDCRVSSVATYGSPVFAHSHVVT